MLKQFPIFIILLFTQPFSYAEGIYANKKTFLEAASIATHIAHVELLGYKTSGYTEKEMHGLCDYFFTTETYEVLYVYKGKLPQIITIKGRGEYCERYDPNIHNLGLSIKETSIMALVKDTDGTFSRIGSCMKDTKKLLKVAEHYSKRK